MPHSSWKIKDITRLDIDGLYITNCCHICFWKTESKFAIKQMGRFQLRFHRFRRGIMRSAATNRVLYRTLLNRPPFSSRKLDCKVLLEIIMPVRQVMLCRYKGFNLTSAHGNHTFARWIVLSTTKACSLQQTCHEVLFYHRRSSTICRMFCNLVEGYGCIHITDLDAPYRTVLWVHKPQEDVVTARFPKNHFWIKIKHGFSQIRHPLQSIILSAPFVTCNMDSLLSKILVQKLLFGHGMQQLIQVG
mmetsp:Transcript_42935/g.103899  ORF Transcript_42935/g.103899 Transcript_42935/m.103899 type:complete len:246 (+) Transcript_42935:1666-2403(+)